MALGRRGTALALAALALGSATPPAQAALGGASGGSSSSTSAAPAGGSAGCQKLERLWEKAGGAPGEAQMAAAVAMAESGGNAGATDNNTNGSTDRGYWQINSTWGSYSTYNPYGNAAAAVYISHDGTDWSPWVTYQHGAETGLC